MVGHHNERPARGRGADLQDGHDVGVAGEPTHRVLLAQEAVEIFLVKVGGQHLDGDRAVQQGLRASIHDAKAAVSDFGDIFEPRVVQLRGKVREQIPRRRMLIDVGHQRSLSHSGGR